MASGYSSGGTDLDDLFHPKTSGSTGATNIKAGGQDLADRYQPRGSTSKIGNVNIKAGGTDISNLFMQKHECANYELRYGIGGDLALDFLYCDGTPSGSDGHDPSHAGDPGWWQKYAKTVYNVWVGTINEFPSSPDGYGVKIS